MTLDGSVLSEDSFVDGSGVTPETAPPAAIESGHGETEPEGSTPEQAPVNWDDPANPYIDRFRGLQGSIQREVERRRALEQQVNALREQTVRAQVAHLAPQQQEQVLAQYRQTQQLMQQQERLHEYERRLEDAARVVFAERFAKQYGVDAEELLDSPTPDHMQRWAERLSQAQRFLQRTRQVQQRQAQEQDRFEGSRVAPTPRPPEPPKTLDEAESRFEELASAFFARRR